MEKEDRRNIECVRMKRERKERKGGERMRKKKSVRRIMMKREENE